MLDCCRLKRKGLGAGRSEFERMLELEIAPEKRIIIFERWIDACKQISEDKLKHGESDQAADLNTEKRRVQLVAAAAFPQAR